MCGKTSDCSRHSAHLLQRMNYTCGSGGEARRDGAAGTARTSRTNPHYLVLALQTDDLVVVVFSHLAATHVLTPGLDLHTSVDLLDQSHVWLMIQHTPHRRRLHILRMASACEATLPVPKASSTSPTAHMHPITFSPNWLTSVPACQLLSCSSSAWCCGLYARSQAWLLHVVVEVALPKHSWRYYTTQTYSEVPQTLWKLDKNYYRYYYWIIENYKAVLSRCMIACKKMSPIDIKKGETSAWKIHH